MPYPQDYRAAIAADRPMPQRETDETIAEDLARLEELMADYAPEVCAELFDAAAWGKVYSAVRAAAQSARIAAEGE